MFWLIVPFSRPEMVSNVLANASRQHAGSCELVMVRNGRARDFCRRSTDRIHWIDSPDDSIAGAMNAGLDYAKPLARPGDWWCKLDDDDWYGPNYLSLIAVARERGANLAGKAACWYRTREGKLWFFDGPQDQWVNKWHLFGPTLAASFDCEPFPDTGVWGEDVAWLKAMLARGARAWACKAGSFCWMRYAEPHRHSFGFGDQTIARLQYVQAIDAGQLWHPDAVEGHHPRHGVPFRPSVEAIIEELR